MSEKLPEGSEKPSEGSRMTTVEQAALLMHQIAEPRPVGDTVKAAITRAARAVSAVLQKPMSYGRVEDIWRREARRIEASEMDAIRAAHSRRASELRSEIQKAQALARYLEGLASSALDPRDLDHPDQFRAAAVEARQAAHTLRRLAAEASGA